MRFLVVIFFFCFSLSLFSNFDAIEKKYNQEKYDDALLLLNEVVASLETDNLFTNYKQVAKASYWYAKCYSKKNDLTLAHEHLVRSEYFLKYDSTSSINSQINHEFANVLYNLGLYEKALEYANREVSTDSKLLFFKINLKLENISSISAYSSLSSIEKTTNIKIEYIQFLMNIDSLSLANSLGLSLLESPINVNEQKAVLLQLGIISKRKKNFELARTYFNKILKLSDGISMKVLIHSMLGIVEFESENFPKAEVQLKRAIQMQEENSLTKYLGNNYNHLANINLRDGELHLALKNANKALKRTLKNDWKTRSISYEILVKANEYLGSQKKIKKYSLLRDEMVQKGKAESLNRVKKANDLKMKIATSKNRLLESLQLQHFGRLAYQNTKLANATKEERLRAELNKKALEHEKMLHTETELMSQLRSEEVAQLSQQNQINQLQLEKNELEKVKNEKQFNLLKSENELNELKLEVQNNLLAQQTLNQRFMIALSIIILLSIGFFFYRFRAKQKNKELKLTQRKMEVESLLFRAQMNPHFLFNSLNSIKGLILSDKTIDADKYLTKFAGLMRHILNNSETSFVQLSKELDMLKLYMDLENLRFDDSFKYIIELDDFLEEEDTYIPSMIIQPHIENAILHGLKSRESGGEIKIKITDEDDYFRIVITDNGVGRDRSQEIRKETYREYKSKATELISKQINILQQEESEVNMEIIDLFDNQQPIGTKVVLMLPLRLLAAG